MIDTDKANTKRVLAVHDLSGFGHTSLLAILPIMYRMGLNAAVLPSALLSANTDHPDYRMVDFGAQMPEFIAHWKELGMRFDAIYTGFLGAPDQVGILLDAFDGLLAQGGIVLVDPVLGDAGKLYCCYGDAMVAAMRSLALAADIITPNATEAALLCGADPLRTITADDCRAWAKHLCAGRTRHCVITSAPTEDAGISRVGHYDRERGVYAEYDCAYIPAWFPGTGDCFAALMLGGIMNGYEVGASIQATVNLLSDAIRISVGQVSDHRGGIALEKMLALDVERYFTPPAR